VDEFRVYQGRLSPEEIQASDILGPNQLLSTIARLTAARFQANNVLSWPVADAGFAVQTATNLTSGWTTLTNAPALSGTNWQITLPAGAGTRFYRLLR
jgi:hypothetical protein